MSLAWSNHAGTFIALAFAAVVVTIGLALGYEVWRIERTNRKLGDDD